LNPKFPGGVEAHAQKLRLAIATSSAYSNVTTLLDINLGAEWRDMFEVVATCKIIEEKKPSPDVYAYVLKQLQLDPTECIAFEDTVNGMRAASAAGIRTVVTTHYFTRNPVPRCGTGHQSSWRARPAIQGADGGTGQSHVTLICSTDCSRAEPVAGDAIQVDIFAQRARFNATCPQFVALQRQHGQISTYQRIPDDIGPQNGSQ
jgi:hypothetical protein